MQKLGISTIDLIFYFSSFSLPTLAGSRRYLGQIVLTYAKNDREVLYTGKCPPNPTIKSLKVLSIGGVANIKFLKVKFQNGQFQNLSVRENLTQGRESRWIDLLQRKNQCVASVAIIVDPNNHSKQRAIMQVFAK